MTRALHGGLIASVIASAAAASLPISRGGTAAVSVAGLCRTASIVFVDTNVVGPIASGDAQELLPTAVERKCVRKLGHLCKRPCARKASLPICTVCEDVDAACRVGAPPLTCPPLPGEEVAFDDTVEVSIEYEPPDPTTHQWSCDLVVRKAGTVVFSGACGQPSKAPLRDAETGAYLLPMAVRDAAVNPRLGVFGEGSFGDFRGYLVVDEALLDRPEDAGAEHIRGLTGHLTYQVGMTWVYNFNFRAPWSFDPDLRGYCVLSGRLHFGDVPQY